ncbi:unnamed protein product [Adineta steineri]|uniref:ADP ribosyltransferase domain-containing protein n=1 Tax=Adineta steineri TaxID=433720 RepID=A0A814FYA6_9BILA|nr:unnamed protein product [Adineta steineri]CAF1563269.1 unnamed protein product [Adineta steineri]
MFIGINDGGTSTTSINGQFVFSQLLIDCLLRLTSNEMDKNELIDYYEKAYEGNHAELDKLNEFQKEYSPEKALWWYTRESFFYKTLNAALRKQTIDMMFLYRSYISDIHRQLQHHQSMYPIQVYRSQLMSNRELNYLQQQKGQLVSVNSFLSTSTDRKVADIYTGGTTQYNNLERVLFEIDADPKVVTAKPFADISRLSHFSVESEVLFMLGSIFRIESINCTDDQLWIIHMSLCREDDHDLKEVLEYMKKQNGIEQTNLCSWSKILLKMGKFDLAKKYYIRCVNELLDKDPLLLMAYEGLADIAYQQNDYDETIKWQQKLNDFKDRMTPVPTCTDGVKNQDETDVDCGGANCSKICLPQQGCHTFADEFNQNGGVDMSKWKFDVIPKNRTYGNIMWPDNGAIYLMAHLGHDWTTVTAGIATKSNNGEWNAVEVSNATIEYMIYTLQWEPDKMEMFVGSNEKQALLTRFFVWEKKNKDWTQWPFDKPFRIHMNLAVGGSAGGRHGIDEGAFPQRMEIDWVRFDEQ